MIRGCKVRWGMRISKLTMYQREQLFRVIQGWRSRWLEVLVREKKEMREEI